MEFANEIYYVTDAEGTRTHVILPIAVYEELVSRCCEQQKAENGEHDEQPVAE